MRKFAWLVAFIACGGGNGNPDGGGLDGGVSDTGSSEGGGNDGSSEAGPAPIAGLRAFFTDLESGPTGAFVTIWGNGFGASQAGGAITIGSGAADSYPVWTATKITFKLGAPAKTGDIVVHVAGKGDSNALPF